MSLPETCPFCGADTIGTKAESWVTFICATTIHAGQDVRRTQSRTCERWERRRLNDRLAALEAENKAMRERNSKLEDCIETAWGIIANAGGGNWETQSPEWIEAAESWRDNQFHPILKNVSAASANVEGGAR